VSPSVANFAQTKVGDMVSLAFEDRLTFVLSGPNTRTPGDRDTSVTVATGGGGSVAGASAGQAVANWWVTGVNPSAGTISLINPGGGEVRTYNVTTPEGRVMFSLKNDDKQEWPALYGVSLMLRQLLGEDPKSQPMRKLAEKLRDQIPQSKPAWGKNWKPSPVARNDDDARAQIDPFKLYYSTYGMYYMGGKDWDNWHEALKRTACEMQDTTIASGAWILNDGWSQCAGDVYSTALMIMSMQVYYRIQ